MIYHNTSVLTNNYSFDKQASVHQMCEELFIFSLSHSFSSPYPLSLLSLPLSLVLCIMSPLPHSLLFYVSCLLTLYLTLSILLFPSHSLSLFFYVSCLLCTSRCVSRTHILVRKDLNRVDILDSKLLNSLNDVSNTHIYA